MDGLVDPGLEPFLMVHSPLVLALLLWHGPASDSSSRLPLLLGLKCFTWDLHWT